MSNDVLNTIRDEDVEYVDIRFTDPRGKLQHVTLMSDQVDEDFIEEGFMFDGSSIAGWKSIDQSDMKLMLDTNSAYMDPFFAEKTLAVHCWSSSLTRAKLMTATHVGQRRRPRLTLSPAASATRPIWDRKLSSSYSTM